MLLELGGPQRTAPAALRLAPLELLEQRLRIRAAGLLLEGHHRALLGQGKLPALGLDPALQNPGIRALGINLQRCGAAPPGRR